MPDNYDAAIADLQKEIHDRMRTVNSLLSLKGLPPKYPEVDGSFSATTGGIRSDQWYGSGLSTAAREFLEMRNASNLGAASVDEIFDALNQGGFKFGTKDKVTSKAALQQSLSKNTAIFHRLPNGRVGLAGWYPTIHNDEEEEQGPRKRHKTVAKHLPPGSKGKRVRYIPKPRGALAALSPHASSGGGSGKYDRGQTVLGAVKTAIEKAANEFTKQDILDWIRANHPTLDAKKESVFSMITHLKDDLGFVTVKAAKGPQPGIYGKKAKSIPTPKEDAK